jgi:hypothetical protein
MTFLLLFGAAALVGAVVFVAMRWGGTKEQRDQLRDIVDGVQEKQEIDNEVENLNDKRLLNAWLKLVRKRSK